MRKSDNLGQSTVMSGLGYNETTWNFPGAADIEQMSYRNIMQGDDPYLAFSLKTLGFETSGMWDCWLNHYLDMDWDELSVLPDNDVDDTSLNFGWHVRYAWGTLGWTEASWSSSDESTYPASENQFWDDLTSTEQDAARILCYTRELWDIIGIPDW